MNGRGGRGFRYETEEERQNRPKVTKKLLSRIFSYLKPYWSRLALSLLTIVVAAVLDVFPSILTGRIIDDGFIGGDFRLLVLLVLLAVGVMVTSSLLGLLENYLNTSVSQHIVRDMKNGMYGYLQQMCQRFFTVNKQGDIITRMTGDIGGIQGVISGTLTRTVSNVAMLTVSIIAMVQKNWLLALVGIAILPLFSADQIGGQRRWKLTIGRPGATDEANQQLNETLWSAVTAGQNLTREEEEYEKFTR